MTYRAPLRQSISLREKGSPRGQPQPSPLRAKPQPAQPRLLTSQNLAPLIAQYLSQLTLTIRYTPALPTRLKRIELGDRAPGANGQQPPTVEVKPGWGFYLHLVTALSGLQVHNFPVGPTAGRERVSKGGRDARLTRTSLSARRGGGS